MIVGIAFAFWFSVACSGAPANKPCTSKGDCLSTELCILKVCQDTSKSGIECVMNTDCGEGKECTNGKCSGTTGGGGGITPFNCTSDEECTSNAKCVNGSCQATGGAGDVGSPCAINGDCKRDLACQEGKCAAKEAPKNYEAYEKFTPLTASYLSRGAAFSEMRISLIDKKGTIACGLANGPFNVPGTASHQIYINVQYQDRKVCPTATLSISGSGCGEEPKGLGDGNCAWYRKWDAQGKLVGLAKATAGAVEVKPFGSACSFTVELVFPGGNEVKQTFTAGITPEVNCKEL